MKLRSLYSIVIGSLFLSILSGCGGSSPKPIVNPPGVETSLASTARAFAKQTEAANPFTATPSPAPTITLTPTPRISMSGTSIMLREDKSALFTDHKLGYQISFPAGWLPVRINEDEYYKAFTVEAVSGNPTLVDFLTKLQSQSIDYIRLIALDVHSGQPANKMVAYITVIHQPETDITLDEWANVRSRNASQKGYQLISKEFQETGSGTKVLVRDESFKSTTDEKIFQRRVFFSVPSGVITMDFEIPLDEKDALLREFEQIIESLTFLET